MSVYMTNGPLVHLQGPHRLEMYFDVQGCLEKVIENKICLEKHLKNTQRP